MKIAQIAPIWYKVPPDKYGGTESVISNITEELTQRGHEITLYATGDSKTQASLSSVREKGLIEEGFTFYTHFYHPLHHFLTALKQASLYDVLHFHFTSRFDYMFMSLVRDLKNVVYTLHTHLPDSADTTGKYDLLTQHYSRTPLVTISHAQRKNLPLNFVATIYNGIDVNSFTVQTNIPAKKLLSFSRISVEKGTLEAIQSAIKSNTKLTLAGNVNTLMERDIIYNKEKIEPLLSNSLIHAVGEKYGKEREELFRDHYAFIFPVQWEEPFGLVLIESLACGTPVIAFSRGSIPEIVEDGVTGFIVNSSESDIRGDFIIKKTGIEGLVEAIHKLLSLSDEEYKKMRLAARRSAEEKFTISKMVDSYESVYKQIASSV